MGPSFQTGIILECCGPNDFPWSLRWSGEETFQDLADVHATYYDSLKQKQPSRPYALADYSYGGMVAIELAKKIEAAGDCHDTHYI